MTEDKSSRYHRLRRRASLGGALVANVVLVGLLASGGAIRLREGLQAASGALLPAGLDEPATVVLLTVAVMALLQMVELPFAWYQGFALERRYGLSTQTPAQWLADTLKAAAVATVLAVLGASVVFTTLRTWPDAWWAISSAVFVTAVVGLARLAPVVLLPMFYRFRPLDRPELVGRLMALADRARTDVVGVFEWGLSGHTRKANAALAGLGGTRRILVSDTMLADYSEAEIEVVLAHELAHHVHRDVWRGLGVQAALIIGGFALADVVLRASAEPLGLRGVADPASIPLLLGLGAAWSVLMMPLVNAVSRSQERAADRFALEATGNPEAFVSAMKRLSQQNMAEERPSTLVRWLFHSHPPIGERIEAARAFTRT